MIKKNIFPIIVFLLIGIAVFFVSKTKEKSDQITIGIVAPITHQALDDIANGFIETIRASKFKDANIIYQSAQGDVSLLSSIIKNLAQKKVDLLVPIATNAAQMTFEQTSGIPILFLAAHIQEHESMVGVIDEIPLKKQVKLITKMLPNVKKITLFFSSSDKVFEEATLFEELCQQENIVIQKIMMQSLADMPVLADQINKDSDAIFVLKDNLVVSGIENLIFKANALKIPLITSDESTVKKGASFALGVIEKDIGVQGGKMAIKLFNNEKVNIEIVSDIKVFVNESACETQSIDKDLLENAAKDLGYDVIIL